MPPQLPVVVRQLDQCVLRRHIAGVVVEDFLKSFDVAD